VFSHIILSANLFNFLRIPYRDLCVALHVCMARTLSRAALRG